MILSIFRYPGGKTRKTIQDWILRHAPRDFQEYREPFVGGGGIFFEVDPSKPRWINDKDEHLIAVYQALKDRPDDFISKCCTIAGYDNDNNEADEVARLKERFDSIAFNECEDAAFRYLFVNRTVWGGRVNYELPSRLYFSNPKGWNDNIFIRLHQASDYLKDVEVTCGDYEAVLTAPGKDVWVYCDPPYKKAFNGATSQLYRHSFQNADHERFAEAIKQSKHKVAVSYEDDPDGYVRNLFDGFNIVETEWTYCGTSVDKKRCGKELLILNYEAPSNLLEFL